MLRNRLSVPGFLTKSCLSLREVGSRLQVVRKGSPWATAAQSDGRRPGSSLGMGRCAKRSRNLLSHPHGHHRKRELRAWADSCPSKVCVL